MNLQRFFVSIINFNKLVYSKQVYPPFLLGAHFLESFADSRVNIDRSCRVSANPTTKHVLGMQIPNYVLISPWMIERLGTRVPVLGVHGHQV